MLKRAAEICGSEALLCERLGITSVRLHQWIEGKARVPDGIFLKSADIVLEDDIARARQDRRSFPRAPESSEPAWGTGVSA